MLKYEVRVGTDPEYTYIQYYRHGLNFRLNGPAFSFHDANMQYSSFSFTVWGK